MDSRALVLPLLMLEAGVLAHPGPAQAQARTTLGWVRGVGAESCIGPVELGQRVERIVGPVLVPASAGQLAVEGRIERAGASYVATVAVSDASGQRLGTREVRGEGEDCRALDDSIAFVIAVAIDPDAALAALPGELSDVGDPGADLLATLAREPPAQPAGFARVTPEKAPPRAGVRSSRAARGEPRMSVAAGPSGVLGALPGPAVGLAAEVGARTGRFWHRAGFAFSAAQRESLSEGGSTELSALGVSLSTCFTLLEDAGLELAPCAGLAAMRLVAQPRGFAGTRQERWLLGPGAGVRLAAELWGPLHAALHAMGHGAWPRQRVVYEVAGSETLIHRTSVAMGELVLSLEVRF